MQMMKKMVVMLAMVLVVVAPKAALAGKFLTLPFQTVPTVTSGWVYNDGTAHNGIDYLCSENTAIVAAADGVAMWSEQDPTNLSVGYGRFVLIRHDNGWFTLYAHTNSAASGIPNKTKNATDYANWRRVSRGEVIAASGNTGLSSGPHLHFELLSGGYAIGKTDPYDIYKKASEYPPVSGKSCGTNHSWTTDPPSLSGFTVGQGSSRQQAFIDAYNHRVPVMANFMGN